MGYIASVSIANNKFIVVPGASTQQAEDAYFVNADDGTGKTDYYGYPGVT